MNQSQMLDLDKNNTITPPQNFDVLLSDEDVKNWAALLIVVIIGLVAMGNILAIMAVLMDRKLQSSTNYFLMSLAVADLLVALTVMPPSLAMIINNYEWPFPASMCGIWTMLDVCFSTCSILHLCMISLDRYLALTNPFGMNQKVFNNNSSDGKNSGKKCGIFSKFKCCFENGGYVSTPYSGSNKRVTKRIILVWATSIGIALPLPILQSQNRDFVFIGNMCAINIAAFQIYGSLVAFFLPLVIMIIAYTLTIRSLQKQAKFVAGILSGGNSLKKKSSGNSLLPGVTNKNFQKNHHLKPEIKIKSESFDSRDDVSLTNSRSGRIFSPLEGESVDKKIDCWTGLLNKFFYAKEVSDWASTDSDDMDFSEFHKSYSKNDYIHRPLQKSDSDSSRGSDNRSPMIVRANLRIGRALMKATRGKSNSSRKISASFKAKAIASISTEQRASKVLGLIFTLFCVFWCPFFVTNVVSRLCTDCDQDLLGTCMNWFVWVGYVSSGVNPLVYTLFSRRFRSTFMCLLACRYSDIQKSKRQFRRSQTTDEPFRNSSFRSNNYSFDRSETQTEEFKCRSPLVPAKGVFTQTRNRLTRHGYHSQSVVVRAYHTQNKEFNGKDGENLGPLCSRTIPTTKKSVRTRVVSASSHQENETVKRYWRTTWPSPIKESKSESMVQEERIRQLESFREKYGGQMPNPQTNLSAQLQQKSNCVTANDVALDNNIECRSEKTKHYKFNTSEYKPKSLSHELVQPRTDVESRQLDRAITTNDSSLRETSSRFNDNSPQNTQIALDLSIGEQNLRAASKPDLCNECPSIINTDSLINKYEAKDVHDGINNNFNNNNNNINLNNNNKLRKNKLSYLTAIV